MSAETLDAGVKRITNKRSTPIRTILARKRILCERWRGPHNRCGGRSMLVESAGLRGRLIMMGN